MWKLDNNICRVPALAYIQICRDWSERFERNQKRHRDFSHFELSHYSTKRAIYCIWLCVYICVQMRLYSCIALYSFRLLRYNVLIFVSFTFTLDFSMLSLLPVVWPALVWSLSSDIIMTLCCAQNHVVLNWDAFFDAAQ